MVSGQTCATDGNVVCSTIKINSVECTCGTVRCAAGARCIFVGENAKCQM